MVVHYFIGIDVGSQGVRAVLLDDKGVLLFERGIVFELNEQARQEQSPDEWYRCCQELIQQMVTEFRGEINLADVKAIGVTSTSGTVIPLNAYYKPLHRAIMYSDKRSATQGEYCAQKAKEANITGFTAFNASCGLSKMLWFKETYPEKANKIAHWVHAADYIVGKLSGQWGITDYTNAFKSGYDVHHLCWPDYITEVLGISKETLPEVKVSGEVLGLIAEKQADILGLNKNTLITLGMTDGCASQIASGAIKQGDWNTTIGTTLVLKGVTKTPVIDPQGRLYSHRHAVDGLWMPGGASNTGADWVSTQFEGQDLEVLNHEAEKLYPTDKIVYPLIQQGERFPFIAPQAKGFGFEGLNPEELFTASMEGVAYMERYAYELITELSGEQVKVVYTAGGASNSELWLKIRSTILNKKIVKMKYVSGAVGAAILAASKTYFKDIVEAVSHLTIVEKEILPEQVNIEKYEMNYQAFVKALLARKFITEKEIYA